MGIRRKQVLTQQKAYFEQKLQGRLSFLSEKGIKSPQADKDPLVKKWQAGVKAADRRLRVVAGYEKQAQELAKAKAEKAAAAAMEKDTEKTGKSGKPEKPKKGAEEGKPKKAKPEVKAAPPKSPEAEKSEKAG